jgi:predicted naringenin-chalcone synthase
MQEKKKDKGTKIELPEEAKKLLNIMIHNSVEDFLKMKEWEKEAKGANN